MYSIVSNIEKRAKMLNILENKSIYLSIYIYLPSYINFLFRLAMLLDNV